MDLKNIETALLVLHDKEVVIIRPMWGEQTDSWVAKIRIIGSSGSSPLRLEWVPLGSSGAHMFKSTDVMVIEVVKQRHIIRLKGPHDYKETFQNH